jgi:hypothetical protein
MSAPGKLVRSSRWKSGPSKGQRPFGSECCVTTGDSGGEAYTAIAWGVGLSHERLDIAGAPLCERFQTIPERICARCWAGAEVVHELLLIINRVGCWQRGLPRPT